MLLEGRKALITGSSRGIGRAIAETFARHGADVALTARRAESLAETIEAVEAAGGTAHAMAWDVLDIRSAGDRLAEARELLGGLDVLVNNAGVVRLGEGVDDPTGEKAWDHIMDVNLKALFFLTESAVEVMKSEGGGVIVQLASDIGLRGVTNAYGISKWGVIGYTKGIAKKVAGDGIRVNAVAPGPTATGMMRCEDGRPKDWPAGPLGRYSLPQEVADVALFLASDESRAVFGETIVVNSANG